MTDNQTTEARCGTCANWRPQDGGNAYDYCLEVNYREGWGTLRHMPAAPDESCHRWRDGNDA